MREAALACLAQRPAASRYLATLYWAFTTMTTVGRNHSAATAPPDAAVTALPKIASRLFGGNPVIITLKTFEWGRRPPKPVTRHTVTVTTLTSLLQVGYGDIAPNPRHRAAVAVTIVSQVRVTGGGWTNMQALNGTPRPCPRRRCGKKKNGKPPPCSPRSTTQSSANDDYFAPQVVGTTLLAYCIGTLINVIPNLDPTERNRLEKVRAGVKFVCLFSSSPRPLSERRRPYTWMVDLRPMSIQNNARAEPSLFSTSSNTG